MDDIIKCAICGKEHKREDTDNWRYHISFPGLVCKRHHGVEKEYQRLLKEANEVYSKATIHLNGK